MVTACWSHRSTEGDFDVELDLMEGGTPAVIKGETEALCTRKEKCNIRELVRKPAPSDASTELQQTCA
jgi:hypothetical protein